jgi:hypothetical protein
MSRFLLRITAGIGGVPSPAAGLVTDRMTHALGSGIPYPLGMVTNAIPVETYNVHVDF